MSVSTSYSNIYISTLQIPYSNQMEEETTGISHVKVYVRVRPLLSKEIQDQQCVHVHSTSTLSVASKQYRFDQVFGQHATSQDIYSSQVLPLLNGCFLGYNATLLAYGQTGSGKTFTMGTTGTSSQGILPLVIDQMFSIISEKQQKIDYTVKVSFIEIYNQSIYDLLSQSVDKSKTTSLSIRQNKDKSISVVGVIEQVVKNRDQMLKLLLQGNLKRSTSSTNMNEVSSRSHAIFTISISQLPRKDEVSEYEEIRAKFHFVDLAGSERLKKTGATGQTKNQGININKGLLYLGDVITALTEPTHKNQKDKHIPYRNSKLTRILQDSLGGNSNTQMIACISPSSCNFQETTSTLKYATRAMNIANKPVVNRDLTSNEIIILKSRICELQEENKLLLNGEIFSRKNEKVEQTYQYKCLKSDFESKIEYFQSCLQQQRSARNKAEIDFYNIKLERDQVMLFLQNFVKQNGFVIPDEFDTRVIDEYTNKIKELQTDIKNKGAAITILQNQLNHYISCSKRDDEILFNKLRQIQTLKREIVGMTKKNIFIPDDDENSNLSISGQDEEFEIKKIELESKSEQFQDKIVQIHESISHRQKILKDLSNSQIVLQNQLIQALKEQYGTKIRDLEYQKQSLQRQIQSANISHNKNTANALNLKKDMLQDKLKQYTKKIKEQDQIAKIVDSQSGKIYKLKDEINRFKIQKVQLNRKIKEEHQQFQNWKRQKGKDISKLNRLGVKKDKEINTLTYQNKKKDLIILRGKQVQNKLKKDKEILMEIMRTVGKRKKTANIKQDQPMQQAQKIAESIIIKLSQNAYKQKHIKRLQDQLLRVGNELVQFSNNHCQLNLKYLRKEQQGSPECQLIRKQMMKLQQEIDTLSQKQQYLRQNIENDIVSGSFDIESELVYNKNYHNINTLRQILKNILIKLERILQHKNFQSDKLEEQNMLIEGLDSKIIQLKECIFQQEEQYRLNLQNVRMELAFRNHHNENLQHKGNTIKDDAKKELDHEKKKNKKLLKQVEDYRKMNELLSDKYEGAKKMNYKDKFIGIHNRNESSSVCKIPTLKERRLERLNYHRYSSVDKFNVFQESKGQMSIVQDGLPEYYNCEFDNQQQKEKNQYQWECFSTIYAHDTAIQHISLTDNKILSTAVKSVKIWDAIQLECEYQITSSFTSWVKTGLIAPQHRLILTGCDKVINLWDSRTYKSIGTLKGTKDTIQTMVLNADVLYAGYSGNQNPGGISIWDLRNQRMPEEREKEDIFSMTLYDDNLYFGGRNRHVKQLNQQLQTVVYYPPHYDVVSCLGTYNNYLISGSKDKNLKVWSIQDNCLIHRSSLQVHNQYINSICTDPQNQLIFSGSRDGQIKISTIIKDKTGKIEVLNCIDGHSDSVNTMIAKNKTLMTGSADRTIKIWRPCQNYY